MKSVDDRLIQIASIGHAGFSNVIQTVVGMFDLMVVIEIVVLY
jgi:hypothetical protein